MAPTATEILDRIDAGEVVEYDDMVYSGDVTDVSEEVDISDDVTDEAGEDDENDEENEEDEEDDNDPDYVSDKVPSQACKCTSGSSQSTVFVT